LAGELAVRETARLAAPSGARGETKCVQVFDAIRNSSDTPATPSSYMDRPGKKIEEDPEEINWG
jgi:hypothetical protein